MLENPYSKLKVSEKWGIQDEISTVALSSMVTKKSSLQQGINEVLKEGKRILSLTGGDPARFPPFLPSDFVTKSLAEAAIDGWNMYSSSAVPQRGCKPYEDSAETGMYLGHPDAGTPWTKLLVRGIVEREKRIHGVDYLEKDISLQPGASQVMNQLYLSLLDPGDEILGPEPTWSQYMSYVPFFKAKFVCSSSIEEERWQPDIQDMRKKITPRTKAILIVNPNNPTGAVYDEKHLREIVNLVGEFGIPLISDEIYDCLTFEVPHSTSIAAISKDVPTLVINAMSKFFAVTGWRVGYLALHDSENKIPRLRKSLQITGRIAGGEKAIATPVQYAAAKAYQNLDKAQEHAKWMVKELKERRDCIMKRISEMPAISCVKPEGAFYAFPRLNDVGEGKTWKNEVQFLTDLVKEEQITFNAGSEWGPKDGFAHFRIVTLAKVKVLEEVFDRLERFLKNHAK